MSICVTNVVLYQFLVFLLNFSCGRNCGMNEIQHFIGRLPFQKLLNYFLLHSLVTLTNSLCQYHIQHAQAHLEAGKSSSIWME